MKTLKVVIPVYNEEEIIETVISDWHKTLETLEIDFEIHVYNDGSKDTTLKKLQAVSDKLAQVRVHDKKNSGHGPTILKAYNDNADTEWIFQIDSDNEISSKYFPELWIDRENYDYLIGQRQYTNRQLPRRIVSLFAKFSVHFFYKKGINDVNIPYRLMRTDKFSADISKIPADTFAPNVIITGIALKRKMRVKQIPVVFNSRETGEVSIKKFKLLKSAIKSFFQTVKFSKCLRKQ